VGNRQQLPRLGQARLTQGNTSPLGLISGGHFIFISQILFVGKSGRWERPLSLSLSWHSEPLSTWRRTVTYDFRPSVWISPLITVMWGRRHLSTVINGAISNWCRMCKTLFEMHPLIILKCKCARKAQLTPTIIPRRAFGLFPKAMHIVQRH